jgi:multiple sugar transport system permease protein
VSSATTTSTPTRPDRPANRKAHIDAHQARAGMMFVAPFLVVFVTMLVVPLCYAAYTSLYREQLIGGTSFVGLDNYTRAFQDDALIEGVLRVAAFFCVQVPIMLTLALLAALAIDSGLLRLSKVVRLGIFLPYAVPSVVATLMWGYLYGRDFGPFAQLAEKVGLSKPDFLSDQWMLWSIGNIVSWEFIGYNMIILYAALRSIPEDLYEAAAVDGAGAVRTAWSIKIPAIRPAILLTVIFSVIGAFQLFVEPQLLRPLAPSVIDTSYTPNLYAYSLTFTSQEPNYAAAVSFLLGLVIVIASSAVLFITSRRSQS